MTMGVSLVWRVSGAKAGALLAASPKYLPPSLFESAVLPRGAKEGTAFVMTLAEGDEATAVLKSAVQWIDSIRLAVESVAMQDRELEMEFDVGVFINPASAFMSSFYAPASILSTLGTIGIALRMSVYLAGDA